MRLRKKRFIRPDVQLRVVVIALCVASLVLLIDFQLGSFAFASVADSTIQSPSTKIVLDELRTSLLRAVLISIAISIPLSAFVGIAYSFKFAGPIYAIGRYFDALKAGLWTRRCHLRQNDDLQDIRDSINSAIAPIMEFLEQNRTALAEAGELLGDESFGGQAATQERAEAVVARLDALERVFAERLSEPEPASSPADETTRAPEPQLESQV